MAFTTLPRKRIDWKQRAETYQQLFDIVAAWNEDLSHAYLELSRQHAGLIHALGDVVTDGELLRSLLEAAQREVIQ